MGAVPSTAFAVTPCSAKQAPRSHGCARSCGRARADHGWLSRQVLDDGTSEGADGDDADAFKLTLCCADTRQYSVSRMQVSRDINMSALRMHSVALEPEVVRAVRSQVRGPCANGVL